MELNGFQINLGLLIKLQKERNLIDFTYKLFQIYFSRVYNLKFP